MTPEPLMEFPTYTEPEEDFIGETFCYYDSGQQKVRECMVSGCGGSLTKGSYYLITHADDEKETIITPEEMEGILAARKQNFPHKL